MKSPRFFLNIFWGILLQPDLHFRSSSGMLYCSRRLGRSSLFYNPFSHRRCCLWNMSQPNEKAAVEDEKKKMIMMKMAFFSFPPTLVRYHIPAAWRLPGKTRGYWRSQTHWCVQVASPASPLADSDSDRAGWATGWALVTVVGSGSGFAAPFLPLRHPRATRTGWSDSPGTAPRSRQCRQTQCTSRSRTPVGPGRRRRLVWTLWASWSWWIYLSS